MKKVFYSKNQDYFTIGWDMQLKFLHRVFLHTTKGWSKFWLNCNQSCWNIKKDEKWSDVDPTLQIKLDRNPNLQKKRIQITEVI